MFSLTRKTDYALVALAELARHAPERSSARDLAERLTLPLPVLRNILKQLTREGLVESARGPQGGYTLARPAERISLVDLIEAMEGPMRLTVCCHDGGLEHTAGRSESGCSCELEGACAIREPVRQVHALMRAFLDRVSVDQIARNELPADFDRFLAADRIGIPAPAGRAASSAEIRNHPVPDTRR